MNPLLIDFGHAQSCMSEPKKKGSVNYMPPEMLVLDFNDKHNYDFKVSDCWSLGVILY